MLLTLLALFYQNVVNERYAFPLVGFLILVFWFSSAINVFSLIGRPVFRVDKRLMMDVERFVLPKVMFWREVFEEQPSKLTNATEPDTNRR